MLLDDSRERVTLALVAGQRLVSLKVDRDGLNSHALIMHLDCRARQIPRPRVIRGNEYEGGPRPGKPNSDQTIQPLPSYSRCSATLRASARPKYRSTTCRARSIPAVRPPPVEIFSPSTNRTPRTQWTSGKSLANRSMAS